MDCCGPCVACFKNFVVYYIIVNILCIRCSTVSANALRFRAIPLSVRSSEQILWPWYLVNGLISFYTRVSAAADRPARRRGSAHAKYSVSHYMVINLFLLLGLAAEYGDRLCTKWDRQRVKWMKGKSIHIAPFTLNIVSKRSDMDHTVLPANYTIPAFSSKAFTRCRHP